MTQTSRFYSVYLSPHAIEIRHLDDAGSGLARLVCSQANYRNALNFALRLARNKRLPLKNLTTDTVEFDLEAEDGFCS